MCFLYLLLFLPGPRYVILPEHHYAFITHLHALGHVSQLVISGSQNYTAIATVGKGLKSHSRNCMIGVAHLVERHRQGSAERSDILIPESYWITQIPPEHPITLDVSSKDIAVGCWIMSRHKRLSNEIQRDTADVRPDSQRPICYTLSPFIRQRPRAGFDRSLALRARSERYRL